MYCYNCGKNIYNGMKKCPYCATEIDRSEINRVVLENTWTKISLRCPEIEKTYSKTFAIGEKEITVSGENYIYAYINAFINQLHKKVSEEVIDYYNRSSLDSLVNDGEAFFKQKVCDVGNAVLGFKYKNSGNITEYDKVAFITMMKHSERILEPIYAVAAEFGNLKESLSERRQSMNIERSGYWVGGGVGISGAIKGKIQADVLNAGAAVANSVANLASKAIQAGIDRSNIEKLKNEVKNSPELKNAILLCLKQFFVDWNIVLSDIYLNDSNKFEEVRGKAYYYDEPDTDTSYLDAVNMLKNDPYNISAYATIYYHNPQTGEDLAKIARFCGIEAMFFQALQSTDKILFEEGKLNLHSVGFDTDTDELRRIKEVLNGLEKNNSGYVSCLMGLSSDNIIKEQRYHRRVDELLALNHIEEMKKLVDKTFDEHSFKDAVLLLIKYNDQAINNLLFYKLKYRLDQYGAQKLISEFDENIPTIVSDALVVYWHGKEHSKYEKMLHTVVKMGHVFPVAYYGEYCYNKSDDLKNEGIEKLLWAAEKNCALALMYVGKFYRDGKGGKYRDRETANSYFNIAVALGEYRAKGE